MRNRAVAPLVRAIVSVADAVIRRLTQIGRHAASLALARAVLALAQRIHGEDSPLVLDALSIVTAILIERDDFEAAEPLVRRASDINETNSDPNRPNVLMATLLQLGAIASGRGEWSGAVSYLERATAIAARAGDARRDLYHDGLRRLGIAYYGSGDYDGADSVLRRLLVLLSTHPERGSRGGRSSLAIARSRCLQELALTCSELERHREARRLAYEALALAERHPGSRRILVRSALDVLASTLFAAGEIEEAARVDRRALGIFGRSVPRLRGSAKALPLLVSTWHDRFYGAARTALLDRAVSLARYCERTAPPSRSRRALAVVGERVASSRAPRSLERRTGPRTT